MWDGLGNLYVKALQVQSASEWELWRYQQQGFSLGHMTLLCLMMTRLETGLTVPIIKYKPS